MKLGKVIGKVWAEQKVPQLHGCRLLVVQAINDDGSNSGNQQVAADPQGIASEGDTVVLATSTDAAQTFETGYAPVNLSVVELVDFVEA